MICAARQLGRSVEASACFNNRAGLLSAIRVLRNTHGMLVFHHGNMVV